MDPNSYKVFTAGQMMPEHHPLKSSVEANYASEFRHRIMNWITHFEDELDDEHEVGVRLVSFGQTVVFHLRDVGYWNPSLIKFHGTAEDGTSVELIQHVTQISILLMKLPKLDPHKSARRIGFRRNDEEDSPTE